MNASDLHVKETKFSWFPNKSRYFAASHQSMRRVQHLLQPNASRSSPGKWVSKPVALLSGDHFFGWFQTHGPSRLQLAETAS